MDDTPHIIVKGNPVDGLYFLGPYPDAQTAIEYAEEGDGDWWIAPLGAPDS